MMNFLKDWIIQYQNKYSVGGTETTIDRITGTVSQEGDTISAAYLNEIQKNCIYQVKATRVIEGVLEIYDISIDGSEEFTPFNQTFLIDFDTTNTRVDSLLRFNGITYSLRFSDSVVNGDKAPSKGFIPKRAVVKLDVSNSKAIIVSSLKFSEETINFTSATGTVVIPSALPVGTKKLIRKVNATQGTITISCAGDTFTRKGKSTINLNRDGDFWLLEKVSNTRWDIIEGQETGTNSNGNYIKKGDMSLKQWGSKTGTTSNTGGSLPNNIFPTPFIDTTYVSEFDLTMFNKSYEISVFSKVLNSAQETLRTYSGGDPGAGVNVTYDYIAIGEW